MSIKTWTSRILTLLLWICISGLSSDSGKNNTQEPPYSHQLPCQPGYYCPNGGSRGALPCPRGTFSPEEGATSVEWCVSCPPHHYGPRQGMRVCVPCGPEAHQPLPGQDRCVCQGEGQSFQPSDGRCVCTLGSERDREGRVCVQRVYDICREGFSRTQHGDCMDAAQWRKHCSLQVCETPEEYQDYDASLGVCVCAGRPERAGVCGDWCRSRGSAPPLRLRCAGDQMVLLHRGTEVNVSGSVFEASLRRWDASGDLRCDLRNDLAGSAYAVETDEAGFFGLFSAMPPEVHTLFQEDHNMSTVSPDTHTPHEAEEGTPHTAHTESVGGSLVARELRGSPGRGHLWRRHSNASSLGVLNPTTCLQQGDVLLFTVTREHHPQYDT
ncbi:uncharacterized protein LOC134066558 [Sardina pilchardus]|uniref:uncharacterized protein LOC134066558 n=1 Tax=Sardina pilchardus TaxID=27697 RepID=UPI002E123DBA